MKRSRKLQAAWDFHAMVLEYNNEGKGPEMKEVITRAVQDLEWPYAWPKSIRRDDVPPCPWTTMKNKCPDLFYSADVLNAFKSKLSGDQWTEYMMEMLTSQFTIGFGYKHLYWFDTDNIKALKTVGFVEVIASRMSLFDAWVEKWVRDTSIRIQRPVEVLHFMCTNSQQLGVRVDVYVRLISCVKPEYRMKYLKWVQKTMDAEQYISFLETVCCHV